MAPVIAELRRRIGGDCVVWSTGQHREMLRQILTLFDLTADVDLDLMRPDQSLNGLFAAAVTGLDRLIEADRPDVILVHGDTSTAAAAAVAAFHRGVRIAHVEAGLRSGRMDQPWPEEFNRRLVDLIGDRLYAPTQTAADALLAEGVDAGRILITGNTVVDALQGVSARLTQDGSLRAELEARFNWLDPDLPLLLVTGHRRESFGAGFKSICDALARLGDTGEMQIVYPVHLNPNVQKPVRERLTGHGAIRLIEPVDYLDFVYLMTRAAVILTDSGGVQEEAPSLGKPVLVMRDVTERPEAVAAGAAELVGSDPEKIFTRALGLVREGRRTHIDNPYGDGSSARRIADDLLE